VYSQAAGRSAVQAMRTMLHGGTWLDREKLARVLHLRAEAHLRRFRYLHRGSSDYREDIPTDAILPLLKVEEGPHCLRLPVLARELVRFLDSRPLPAARTRCPRPDFPPMPTDEAVSLLISQDDERLLLALDDLLRHRVRQEQHHWWCRQNPGHGRWLRRLKRAQTAFPGLVRSRHGWHWVLHLDRVGSMRTMVETGEIFSALRDRGSRDTPSRVLNALKTILDGRNGGYILLGEVVSMIVDLERADYSMEVATSREPAGPSAYSETDRMVSSIFGEKLREELTRRCSELVAGDRARDARLGKAVAAPEVDPILVSAVVDDLVRAAGSGGRAPSLRGRLADRLPLDAADDSFAALYEKARYLRRRLASAGEELVR